ncbi:hypothetical protein A1O7_03308 [Cladophialophora yegresii CBS 114405]|uniref:Transmembrane protein n=1 Tax=Cladophialophora yegresii CBS 114405 TaxID=1182544 RepID=W9WE92_9EURO|nr:uncharacterized protein A1O7_03308 [Cladophialophora yegresii CBS 114405]EXJ62866.1 hypothetical protein A1O7_03308 [Cladophialophora yegresii CBS 114405]
MPPKGSRSPIPVFVFLGVVLVFLPIAALVCVCLQRRHKRRQAENSRAGTAHAVAESMHRWSKSAPIEMGDMQPPSAVTIIRPIRDLSMGKRPVHHMHGALGAHEAEYDSTRIPTTQIDALPPTRVDEYRDPDLHRSEAMSSVACAPFSDSPPLHSPRYTLQAALGSEDSPASIQTGGERVASLSDAPRVKSQKVSPQEAAQAYHGAERPAMPEFETGYVVHEHQQLPRGWL